MAGSHTGFRAKQEPKHPLLLPSFILASSFNFFFPFMPLVYIRLEIEKENVKCPMEGVHCSLWETSFFLKQGRGQELPSYM